MSVEAPNQTELDTVKRNCVCMMGRDGRIVGVGFRLSKTHIITCAHVVAYCLGFNECHEHKPEEKLNVSFPFYDDSIQNAVVEAWYPALSDEEARIGPEVEDIAILTIVGEPPEQKNTLNIAIQEHVWDQGFRVLGFPEGHTRGVWAEGVIKGEVRGGWMQIVSASAIGHAIVRGFSGSPVWNDSTKQVIGMIVAADADKDNRTAYFIPAKKLVEAWPQINAKILMHEDPLSNLSLRKASKIVTIMVATIHDHDEIVREQGDVGFHQVFSKTRELIKLSLARYQATLHTFNGPLIVATFTRASEAVMAALDIQSGDQPKENTAYDSTNEEASLSIGLNLGEVVFDDDLPRWGRHIAKAAALADIANPGQVLTTSNVKETGRDFVLPRNDSRVEWSEYGTYILPTQGPIELHGVACGSNPISNKPARLCEDQNIAFPLEIPGLTLGEKIGEGCMGATFSSRRKRGKESQKLVLKVMNYGLQNNYLIRTKFISSVKRMMEFNSPGLVKIIDFSIDGIAPYFTMPFVQGYPLNEHFQRIGKKHDWKYLIKTVLEICKHVSKLHENEIVHGNLKPNNILVTDNGEVSILDAGMQLNFNLDSKWEDFHNIPSGTPLYLSPDQVREGLEDDLRTDIYALGAIIYEVITGKPPFENESLYRVLNSHLFDVPARFSITRPDFFVPAGLEYICFKALEKKPGNRQQSIRELSDELVRVMKGEKITTRPSFFSELIEERAQSHEQEIQNWYDKKLIINEEYSDLSEAYARLRNIDSDDRKVHPVRAVLVLGALMTVLGTVAVVQAKWEVFSEWILTLIGVTPALVFFIIANYFRKYKRVKTADIYFVATGMAIPIAVWTLCLKFEFLQDLGPPLHLLQWLFPMNGLQMLLGIALSLVFSIYYEVVNQSIRLSALTITMTLALSVILADVFDIINLLEEPFALSVISLGLIASVIGAIYSTGKGYTQSVSRNWFGVSVIVLIIGTQLLALDVALTRNKLRMISLSNSNELQASLYFEWGVLVSVSGLLYYFFGISARHKWASTGGRFYQPLLFVAPIFCVAGLIIVSDPWHSFYGLPMFLGLPWSMVAAFIVSLGLVVIAIRSQIRYYLPLSSILIVIVVFLADLVFVGDMFVWRATLMTLGVLATGAALLLGRKSITS